MLNNDISADAPVRILVHVSDIFHSEIHIDKAFRIFPRITSVSTPDLRAIAQYTRWSDKGVLIHLFHYRKDGYPAQEMFDSLDDDGILHPFGKLLEFEDVVHLQHFSAYSRDIRTIVDPLHPLAFGSKSWASV